jgi:predicted cupin superfamily sugar epimerase
MNDAEEIIRLLDLRPHPCEGGYYRETYRSADRLPRAALPAGYAGDRVASTAIYYLLTPDTFSALHRLPTDEIFHFYLGGPIQMLQLLPDGSGQVVVLGPDLRAGQRPQLIVPRGVWQGSSLAPGAAFALLGATVAPGFDFSDYEAGDRADLCARYPAFADLIARLTPSPNG